MCFPISDTTGKGGAKGVHRPATQLTNQEKSNVKEDGVFNARMHDAKGEPVSAQYVDQMAREKAEREAAERAKTPKPPMDEIDKILRSTASSPFSGLVMGKETRASSFAKPTGDSRSAAFKPIDYGAFTLPKSPFQSLFLKGASIKKGGG